MTEKQPLLELQDVGISIEDKPIVNGLDLAVREGEAVGLIGRNGVGKTTTFRGIMGQSNVTRGSIRFKGTELTSISPNEIAPLGIGYAPEDKGLFTGMSVDENIRMPIWVSEESVTEEDVVSDIYNHFPEIKSHKGANVEDLSGGQAKMTAICRALALQPELLLLDEPLEGLAPTIVEDIKDIIKKINKQGVAVMLAEANLAHATELVDRAYIIERGEIYASGPVEDLIEDPEIQNLLQG